MSHIPAGAPSRLPSAQEAEHVLQLAGKVLQGSGCAVRQEILYTLLHLSAQGVTPKNIIENLRALNKLYSNTRNSSLGQTAPLY